MDTALKVQLESILGDDVVRLSPLTGGCIAGVYRVDLAAGDSVVAKVARSGGGLAIEGWMLDYLRAHSDLPAPELRHCDDALLVMSHLAADGRLDAEAEADAADHLAALHAVTAAEFGMARDTVIGGMAQPNTQTTSWRSFFAEQRLLYMAEAARAEGRLPARMGARIEWLAARLERWIDEPDQPSLIHGDMWGGNVLCRATAGGNRIAGFVDPAIYYADAEVELAFSTLFNTFGDAFFARYNELRPLRPGFFEARRDLYNLYPLLVHVRLFGAGYVASVARTLDRFGA